MERVHILHFKIHRKKERVLISEFQKHFYIMFAKSSFFDDSPISKNKIVSIFKNMSNIIGTDVYKVK